MAAEVLNALNFGVRVTINTALETGVKIRARDIIVKRIRELKLRNGGGQNVCRGSSILRVIRISRFVTQGRQIVTDTMPKPRSQDEQI